MPYLRAFGCYLPSEVVTNAELAPRVAADPAWLEHVTGIQERRFAAPNQSVADLAVFAARDCLQSGGMNAREIGFVVVASGTAERRFPGPAASIAAALGIPGVPAIDLPMASAGSLFGICLAADLTPRYGNVLVIGAEIMSRVLRIDAAGRDTAVLFGDGAGACVVSPDAGFAQIKDSLLASDGDFGEALQLYWDAPLYMDGRTVILHAARKLPRAINELLERNGCKPAAVDTYLLHQANLNLITRVAHALHVPEERFFQNLCRYGNTSSASLLIAAAEWRRSATPNTGSPIILAAFGAGFHWGAMLAYTC
ncbi:MAG: ketoacyl-ACP synthase III [Acidobacteriia bacterium]|nr:ketoacyl-ACP synthase III [Terriglobia bacterium]